MLVKRQLPNGKVEVTFSMPALDGVTELYLVGDFNQWSPTAHALSQTGEGAWTGTVVLEPGEYQYRYFANGAQWHDDWQADAYVPNQFGGQNSVVRIAAPEAEAAAPSAETPSLFAPAAEAEPAKKKTTSKPKAEKAPKDPAAPKKKRTKKND